MSSNSKSPTRDRILEAACALLEDDSGTSTRMADIARAADVSRQAVYLHFQNRADLLTAALRHRDEQTGLQENLAASRAAATGEERIARYVEFWADHVPRIQGLAHALLADHVPRIQGLAHALLAMRDSDPAAAAAWDERMAATRDGCEACILALAKEGRLAAPWQIGPATDLFWAMLSVQNWMLLTGPCGWSQQDYAENLTRQATRTFVTPAPAPV